jgi:hypothetical protein
MESDKARFSETVDLEPFKSQIFQRESSRSNLSIPNLSIPNLSISNFRAPAALHHAADDLGE